MSTVVLSGADDPLGHRVAAALGRSAGVQRIVTLDDHELHSPDLKARIEGADAVIHLGGGLEETRAVLDAAGAVGATHLVLLSSATVYGAWANNPVPLTEDAPLRPNPELDFAVRAAERERLASEWKHEHPGATVAVLRPAVPVAEDASGWLGRGLRETSAIRGRARRSAGAVRASRRRDIGDRPGIVEPTRRSVQREPRRVDRGRSTPRARGRAGRARARARGAAPGLVAVATRSRERASGIAAVHDASVGGGQRSDQGRRLGPAFSNEEAYVAGHRPAPWATVSPQRRQELALAGASALIVGLVVGVIALIRRSSRRG